MVISELGQRGITNRLAGEGLFVEFGPFKLRIRSNLPESALAPLALYGAYPLLEAGDWVDFHVSIIKRRNWGRYWRPQQVLFALDGLVPFAPYPIEQAFPALEWGINWCIATRAHHLLMLHCAVVERRGLALLLPAWPGHGKSTLCAALAFSGWRLLSDEFGLVRPEDGSILPIPRLIPLKNQSIDVIAERCPEAVMGPRFYNTRKGTVAHVVPPPDSLRRAKETAKPRWLVFPRWIAGAATKLRPMAKSEAFLMVATNAFNYEVLDETAFRLATAMVESCECHSLVYSDLAEAVDTLDRLAQATHD